MFYSHLTDSYLSPLSYQYCMYSGAMCRLLSIHIQCSWCSDMSSGRPVTPLGLHPPHSPFPFFVFTLISNSMEAWPGEKPRSRSSTSTWERVRSLGNGWSRGEETHRILSCVNVVINPGLQLDSWHKSVNYSISLTTSTFQRISVAILKVLT